MPTFGNFPIWECSTIKRKSVEPHSHENEILFIVGSYIEYRRQATLGAYYNIVIYLLYMMYKL